jgi:glycerophosphoryl diester phosphodiesterase
MSQRLPLSLRELVRAVASDFRRTFAVLVAYEALFKLLTALVIFPAFAALLFHLVRLQGRTALTNTDIVGFLLSPLGVCYGFLLGIKLLGVAMLEHAGAMGLAALKETDHWHGVRHALLVLAMRSWRVLRLAGKVLLVLVAVLAPFVVLAALTYGWLLGDQDVNYYLAERPPRFYVACLVGASLLVGALSLAGWFYVRWSFALPILLFEEQHPLAALRTSAERTAGIRWRLAGYLLTWLLVGLLGQAIIIAGFKLLASGLLTATGRRPEILIPEVTILLVIKGVLLAILSGLMVVFQSLLLLRLHVERGVQLGVLDRHHWGDGLEKAPEKPRVLLRRFEWGAAGLICGIGIFFVALTLPFDLRDETQVTAHRGYSAVAPENTLAAIEKAIEVGADWAEIDVQLTADEEIVLLHDNDLKRMTGDPRRLINIPFSDLKSIPLDKRVFQNFPDERIPTLRQAIDLARGRIGLNIELKFPGKDRRLAQKVAELLREEEFENECFVASLEVDGVLLARKHNPKLKTAAIVTVAAGDISKLDVDILSVNIKLATDRLLRKAQRQGKQIHVWTVNEPREMRRLIEHGVNNIITDHPDRFLAIKEERAGLGDGQRLLLTCRYMLD